MLRDFLTRQLLRPHRLAWCLIFGLGVALRLALFSGYGLGDDPNYFSAFYRILVSGTYDPTEPYDLRFGIWVPVVLSMKLLGRTEVGFIGAITAASIVNLALVYLLARQEWGRRYGLLAMAFLAVFPLDVLCATLFANDMLLATYCFAALWLFRRSLDAGGWGRVVSAAGSTLFLFFGFVTKPWVVLVGPLFLFEAARRWRTGWSHVLGCGLGVALLVGGYLGWQWTRFGDPLYHLTLSKQLAIFLPYGRDILLDYPRMLFLTNEHGSRFAGFYPHVLGALAVLFAWRVRAGKWLVFFMVILAGLSGLPSHRVNGQWVTLVPHIFRYLCLISIPLCLALTAYVRELYRLHWSLGAVLTAALLGVSVPQAVHLTAPSRDAFDDQRRTAAALVAFEDEGLWCNDEVCLRFRNFYGPDVPWSVRIRYLRAEDPVRRQAEFAAVTDGVVVTGGPFLPWYGCTRCTPDIGDFRVPPTWTLVKQFDAPLTSYRREPFRFWRVSTTMPEVKTILDAQPDGDRKIELLRDMVAGHQDASASEAGMLLLHDSALAGRAELLYLTGVACSRASKSHCADSYLKKFVAAGGEGEPLREALRVLALGATGQGDFRQARGWVAELRRRFPREPLDPSLGDLESGMAEGYTRYHQDRLPEALRLFREVVERDEPADRRKARYFLALTLFRLDRVAEAVEQSDAFKEMYGENTEWVELHYRHAERLLARDQAAARVILGDIMTRFPESFWAGVARERLDKLSGEGRPSKDVQPAEASPK